MRRVAHRNQHFNEQIRGTGEAPKLDSDALIIRGPMEAQSRYQRKYITKYDRHLFPAYLVSKTKEKLYSYQEELERQQREEEDRLMAQFHQERLEEAENMKKEFEAEWESQLKDLTSKFEGGHKQKDKTVALPVTERFEEAKEELKKTMTVRMQKKKEATTLRLQRKAQQETATLIKKHSQQMLELLQSKQEELEREFDEEIKKAAPELEVQEDFIDALKETWKLPAELPEAHAPRGRKRDLYHDPSVFTELDEDVFAVAESEQSTFTDLVKQLTMNCLSDLQKARAIFRWITVKDLNTMEFDESVKQDTPLGLLRGIKFGTETYHTLFMRLCSYAGLPCHEVKGHAKSVGYEPGMKIPEDKFQNTWNVVLIMGDWWPVQCNWGARHLVLNKDLMTTGISKKPDRDKIRYQYDEHYFLTDPDEFIQEFWAKDPEWQLLDQPISLEEFESLPFVRSIFFHYNLEFIEPVKAVIPTDQKGGAEVKINVPDELGDDVIFHYQLFFADPERRTLTEFRGVKLDRFVYHSLSDGCALFSVHVPTPGSYYLEIFANKIDSSNKLSDDPNAPMAPFRLKCACKFKLVCDELSGKMHPLPNCATGEWGPAKARRHFGLEPKSHSGGVINVNNTVEIRFRQPRPLYFVFKLRFNDIEDSLLKNFVAYQIVGDLVMIRVNPPNIGQYGLDIYAQPEEAKVSKGVLAHACKYLLNCTNVDNPVELVRSPTAVNGSGGGRPSIDGLSVSSTSSTSIGALSNSVPGARPAFDELGLKTISHQDALIQKIPKGGQLTIEIGHPETIRVVGRLTSVSQAVAGQQQSEVGKVDEKTKGKKTKYLVTLPVAGGTFSFELFAVKKGETRETSVFNYIIDYRDNEDPKKKKK
jgi:hypothetical protein